MVDAQIGELDPGFGNLRYPDVCWWWVKGYYILGSWVLFHHRLLLSLSRTSHHPLAKYANTWPFALLCTSIALTAQTRFDSLDDANPLKLYKHTPSPKSQGVKQPSTEQTNNKAL